MKILRFNHVFHLIRMNKLFWFGVSLLFPILYYLTLLVAPMVKFRQWPNYISTYDWLENVERIITSTPSWSDRLMIIRGEWLLEIGYMNYDFGIGISQWSLFIAPVKVLGILLLGALLSTLLLLIRSDRKIGCSVRTRWATKATGGLGAGLVALTSVSLSWVVCCSTPTWVVGLAMMGLGVSTSLWLEPVGGWVQAAGLILMLGAIYISAGKHVAKKYAAVEKLTAIDRITT